jgi:hypothetical protein
MVRACGEEERMTGENTPIAGSTGRQRDEEIVRLAARLGNVAEACRQLGVDRSAYYRALRRQRKTDGTEAFPRAGKAARLETTVLDLARVYPDWGCDRIAWYLTLKGDAVSSPTIQKVLLKHGLGRASARRAAALAANGTERGRG